MKYNFIFKSLFVSLLLVSFVVTSQEANEKNANTTESISNQVKILDDFIKKGINTWNPPGLAVTVVKDGEIIFKKGYGVTTIGTNKMVDENTLFGCMSTTKAFVAVGLAMLVDDGKLNWDDKVIKHLPNFKIKDSYITNEITVRDLLTHRTGVGNTDILWGTFKLDSDKILTSMSDVDKVYSLRSSFIYQNVMYLAAGKIIEAVSGQTWGEFLKNRVYTPLGMKDTYSLLSMIETKDNKADAHNYIDGKIEKINQLSADNIGPAGSMWSTINDIGKWVQFLLNDGKIGDNTLISRANFDELFKPQQMVPEDQFYPTQQITKPKWKTYGLGWFQHDYKGKMIQFHTGSLPGMVAIVGMIPDEDIGVYVMGNLDHVELRHAIMYTTFDLFMDGKITRDWSKELYEIYHPVNKNGKN